MMDFENEKNITIFTHPLIQHKISILRDKKQELMNLESSLKK